MILFLDFDGVLHPDAVFLSRKGPQLRGDGTLFMWTELLESELKSFPDVKIVLSSSWVRHLGFSRSLKRLPAGLRSRVVGATWHSSMGRDLADKVWWDQSTRYSQIVRYVARATVSHWIAIDDDDAGWAPADRDKLVHTSSVEGLSDSVALAELRLKLFAYTSSRA